MRVAHLLYTDSWQSVSLLPQDTGRSSVMTLGFWEWQRRKAATCEVSDFGVAAQVH